MQSDVVSVVQHSDDLTDNMALWDKSDMARVSRIVRIDGFQPVIVCLGTCLKARHQQWTALYADGVARNSFATSDEDPCN